MDYFGQNSIFSSNFPKIQYGVFAILKRKKFTINNFILFIFIFILPKLIHIKIDKMFCFRAKIFIYPTETKKLWKTFSKSHFDIFSFLFPFCMIPDDCYRHLIYLLNFQHAMQNLKSTCWILCKSFIQLCSNMYIPT